MDRKNGEYSKIWINSKVKEGTTVFIAIPIIEEDVSK